MALPEITLYIHYLCPYAQRALYASAFKGLRLNVVEMDMENKPDWFLAMNPFGKVPTVKVVDHGKEFYLYESIQVAEYFDSFAGPSLYPRRQDGTRDPLRKALIDIHVKNHLEPLANSFFPFYFREPSDEEVAKAKASMRVLNDKYLGSGNYLMHSVLGEDVMTMADLLMFPIVERLVAMKDTYFKRMTEGENYDKAYAWFSRLSETQWAQKYMARPQRFNNLLHIIRSGAYRGLAVPLSKYD